MVKLKKKIETLEESGLMIYTASEGIITNLSQGEVSTNWESFVELSEDA